MKPTERARLTSALRDQVAKIAADLRGKMRAPGPTRERAQRLHVDEQVAEDFDVWTDLLSRRAAVLWVLKSVYLRVLEDRGLLSPGRLLDPEAQQLFERLAPHLGETAFLRWVYRDLASARGGLPELFSPQPAEVALPSDELSRALIRFWREREADTGATWSFADEHFEGELMGDLYQELDPVVKDRFALCQTPDFVRAFILDRTLTPALETFGADQVRLLDPACGSGHFLIDGLKRLVAATAEKHPEWDKKKLVKHCLERVVGIDLNDYACALARARLVMTAAELAGVGTLAEAAQFHPHVYWADGLEQVEKGKDTGDHQLDLLDPSKNEAPKASLTRPEVRAALRTVLEPQFHAIVANPPYSLESDEKRRAYHRESAGSGRRYLAALGKYSLAAVFSERAFQLTMPSGYVGLIIPNNFMTRSFGKGLVEGVLSRSDLELVVDLSGAILADSGFEVPTIMLFARNRPPSPGAVRVTVCRKGDTDRPEDFAHGKVWLSSTSRFNELGFQNEYVGVLDCPREVLGHHPWSLSDVESLAIKTLLETHAELRLRDVAQLGITAVTGEDSCFVLPLAAARRLNIESTRTLVVGAAVRDWAISQCDVCIFPYDERLEVARETACPSTIRFLWRFKPRIKHRRRFGVPMLQRGLSWYELQELYDDKLREPLTITSPAVSTHNQFALDRSGALFNRTAPVVKLAPDSSLVDYYHVLGLLNSSAVNFWMRQVLHKVGGRSSGTKRQSETWAQRMDFSALQMEATPITNNSKRLVAKLAERLCSLAGEQAHYWPSIVLDRDWELGQLAANMLTAQRKRLALRRELVAVQEELDWATYAAYGIVSQDEQEVEEDVEPLAPEHRPFAIRLARAAAVGAATAYWFEAMNVQPATDIPETYGPKTRSRIARRLEQSETLSNLALLESPEYKRKWEPIDFQGEVAAAASEWLASRIEEVSKARPHAVSLPRLVSDVQGDVRFLEVAALVQGRRDVDLLGLVTQLVLGDSVPSHSYHVYTRSGLTKRAAWESAWDLQAREDAGEKIETIPVPPEYSQGSRGKSTDFLKNEYWQLRGKLDVPKERFIAFTEVPGRTGSETRYGWAGWTPVQRLRAILAMDENLEDADVPLADRIGLLDSAWRLLPDVAREDPAAAARLKAELQALVGPKGPSPELVEDWKKRFPPPSTRASKTKRAAKAREKDLENEENDES